MYRGEYIARNSRLLKERGRKWSRRLWDFLLAHPCVDCGETDPMVLEFDHVDSTTKRHHVGSLARAGYPWSAVLAELDKCEVRCANCHRKRTAQQFEWPKLAIGTRGHTVERRLSSRAREFCPSSPPDGDASADGSARLALVVSDRAVDQLAQDVDVPGVAGGFFEHVNAPSAE